MFDQTVFPARLAGRGARRTRPDQPLMVVVFVGVARAPAATAAAVIRLRVNRWACNMAEIVIDAEWGMPYSMPCWLNPTL